MLSVLSLLYRKWKYQKLLDMPQYLLSPSSMLVIESKLGTYMSRIIAFPSLPCC